KTAGSQSITVQDVTPNTAIIPATQSNILMQPAAADHLQVAGFPLSVIAGTSHSFTVTALDPYGNTATSYLATVHLTSRHMQQDMLPADYTFTSSDAGVHNNFSATLNTSDMNQWIMAIDTVNAGINGMEGGINVVSMQPTAGIIAPAANASGFNGVPGQPLVYALNASESGLDSSTSYTFTVTWGDGSMQTVSGPSGTQVS